jgi:hypothetical protein
LIYIKKRTLAALDAVAASFFLGSVTFAIYRVCVVILVEVRLCTRMTAQLGRLCAHLTPM